MRLFLIALVLAAPLASSQTADGLVGEWRQTASTAAPPPGAYAAPPTPAPFRFVFAEDGSVLVEAGGEVAYTFDGSTLTLRIVASGPDERLASRLDGDTLTMTDPDDGSALVYARDGGAEGDGIVGRWLRPGAEATSGPPAGFEFDATGTTRAFYSTTAQYTAERGTLSVGAPIGLVANVRVMGDRMRLVEKTRVSTYTRGSGAAAAAPVIVLERTPCYGRCPVYSLAAYADGRVVWTGTQHVATLGTAERQVPPALVAELVAAAEAAGHAGLPEVLASGDVCEQFRTDNPGARTTVRTAAGTHSVLHNYGCRGFRGEAALTAFETAIDRALGTSAWGGEPPTAAPR